MDSFFFLVIIAAALAGGSLSFLGVYIVGMRLPFIGTCISHAAMAGAVFAVVFGVSQGVGAVVMSVLAALSMAAIPPEKARIDTNVLLAILFSVLLGLTFLGIGLVDGSRSELLGLLWGSILFVSRQGVLLILGTAILAALFAFLFNKEMKVLLFSRSIASATGIHDTLVYGLFLAVCGLTISVNLPIVGGLMIFSLITNPAAAAYQICRGHRAVVGASILIGVLSAVGGFAVSYLLDWPTGACIVLLSSVFFAVAVICKVVFRNQ